MMRNSVRRRARSIYRFHLRAGGDPALWARACVRQAATPSRPQPAWGDAVVFILINLIVIVVTGLMSAGEHNAGPFANITRDNRVSITIDHDEPQVMKITGLSMAARAVRVEDPRKAERIMALLIARYPQQGQSPGDLPPASAVAIFKVSPTVISALDYAKGFGHTELAPNS